MSSSGGSSAISMPPPPETGPLSPTSPRAERKRTVVGVISNEEPAVPSCLVQMRGPPVVLSGVRRPSTSTLEPFFTYWLQASADFPHVETRNQIVSLTCSPFPAVYWRLVATEKDVTACPDGV